MSNVPSRVQFRRANASAWTIANPTLAAGELGYELDTGKFKIGNGNDDWTTLGYSAGGGGGGEGGEGNTSTRFTQVFTRPGPIEAKMYKTKWVATDGDYTISKVSVVVGTHDDDEHPNDGCPIDGGIYVQLKKFNLEDEDPVDIFAEESLLNIEAETHRASSDVFDVSTIYEGEILRVVVSADEVTTNLGSDLAVTVVLESPNYIGGGGSGSGSGITLGIDPVIGGMIF